MFVEEIFLLHRVATEGKPAGAKEGCYTDLPMWHYVYILQNERGRHYIGLTDNIDDRLSRHNRGEIPSTNKYKPWKIIHFATFLTREKAAAYEKYLKSGSGTTFRQRHLI